MAYPKPYLLLCLFIFSVLVLRSQDCSNLGPGLFPDGDFGAGIELVATDTPYLAPFWYTYTPAPPLPGDAYSITNNTAPWAAASGEGWLSTTDNSPDPEGYMMVVNSTQNATVFWVRSIHLCGDAYYRVAFDAINLQHPDSALAPQPILQLYVNSELQANFGALPQDGQWHTFEQDIYLAAPAGGNVLFELFNSNPGLAGNDFAIDNLSLQRCGPSAEVFSTSGGPACPGDAASFGIDIGPGFSPPYIQWQSSTDGGATWQDSGSPGTATSHTIPVLLPGAWVRALVAGTLAELDNENCPLPSTIFQPQFLDINSCFELPVSLNGGLCGGQYGENIFPEGDFGSGSGVFGPELPPGATNLAFQNTTWPNDGFYALMNYWDEDICEGFFPAPCWILPLSDNSDDPQGYGMVVNATEGQTGIFYTTTIDGLCENTTYQFSADIINLNTRWFAPYNTNNPSNSIILPNIDFIIGAEGTPFEVMQVAPEVYNTGDILNDSTWNTYGFSFTTNPGVSSITFALRNNAPGGGGNDFILDNISFRMCGQADIYRAPLCFNETAILEALFDSNLFPSPAIQWQRSTDNGLTWTDVPGATAPTLALPGPVADDQYRYLLAGSPENLDSAFCRLTSSVNSIDFLQALTSNISDVICNGASYSIGGSSYSQTGVYEAYFTAANGCDSIVTLELTVLDTALAFFSASVCEGDTYEFQGNLLSAPGVYTEVLSAANGCDSTIRLTLEVLALERDTIAGQICEGERYSFGGQELAATGFYERTVSGSNGCDSTIILDLLVHPVVNTNRAVAICEGEQYSFDGQQLSAPGNYQAQYQSQFGCDSTVSLSLAVLPLLRDTVQAEICEGESFSFDGQSLFLAGIYEAIDNSSNGCDSITTLLLTVRPRGSSQFFQSICQGESYTFGGQELTATGSYEQTLSTIYGCDSLVTLELEVLPLSIGSLTAAICEGESYPFGARQLNQAGVYERTLPGSNGCDSTVILELSVLPVYDQQVSVDLCRGEFFAGVQVLADTILRFAGQTSNGCDSIVNYTINVESIPGFEIQGARPLCGDFTITLSAGSFAGYAWSTGTSLPELVVSSPGWYAVTVTDQQGCTAVDSVLVADEGYTPEVELLDPLCAGEASGSISFVHIDGGTPPFLYSIDGGAFRDSTVYNGLPAGTYQLAIQDGTGCEWARTVQLTSPPPLSARIVGGQDIALGDSTQLRVVSLGDSLVLFDWQPAGGLSCSDCPAPVARPAQSTTYLVAVQDANGCEDRLQVEIRVEDSRRLYAPNAFSPNEDGRNDVFTVYPGPGVARIVAFQVFDRWGNKVYEAEGQGVAPPPGWDGTRKGQRLNPAVFAWLAEVEFIDGSVRLYEGEVSLIR